MNTAVAQRAQSTAVAVKAPSNFEIELANYEPQIAAALPAHIPVERFKRTVLTAINQNPDLFNADRRSLFLSCVRAAQDGLFPDGREAALVIFNTKKKGKDGGKDEWIKAVQYMPMIHGIRKRMRNTKEVLSADAQVVYSNDHFDYRLGDDPMIDHKPVLGDRGDPIGAYAIIKLVNGEVLREVMSVAEIEKVRGVSRSKDNGPWVTWWTEMARKVVLRRCSKAAPTSSDLDEMLRRDDEAMFGQQQQGETVVSIAPARPRRADFVEPELDHEEAEFTGDIANEVATEMGHDPETGEVIETATVETAPAAAQAETADAKPQARARTKQDDAFFNGEDLEIPAPRGDAKNPDWHGWGKRLVALIDVAQAAELEVLRSHNSTSRERCFAAADPKIVSEVDRAFAAAEKRASL